MPSVPVPSPPDVVDVSPPLPSPVGTEVLGLLLSSVDPLVWLPPVSVPPWPDPCCVLWFWLELLETLLPVPLELLELLLTLEFPLFLFSLSLLFSPPGEFEIEPIEPPKILVVPAKSAIVVREFKIPITFKAVLCVTSTVVPIPTISEQGEFPLYCAKISLAHVSNPPPVKSL